MKRLLSIVLMLCLVISLTGCAPKPEASVKNYFDSLSKGDYKTASTYVKNEISFENDIQKELMNKITKKLQVKIIDSKTDGDKAIVNAEITALDMTSITGSVFAEVLPKILALAFSGIPDADKQGEEMMMTAFTTAMDKADAKTVTTKLAINLSMSEDKKNWIIEGNEELGDAMTGGMITAFSKMSENMQSQSSQPAEIKADESTYSVGEPATIGRTTLTIKNVERSPGGDYDKPKAGHEYVIVTLHQKNTGNNGSIAYDSYSYKVQNGNGQVTGTTYTSLNSDTEFGSGELVEGGEVEGTLVFEVPKGDTSLQFLFVPEDKPMLRFSI